MSTDLRAKLRRLGVQKGAAKIQPPRREHGGRQPGSIESLVDGYSIDTPLGAAFVHEETYAIDHSHGSHALGDVLSLSPSIAAQIGNEPAFENVDLSQVAFLDTETTGLSGGTGTFAFLVGVGAFQNPSPKLQTSNSKLQTPNPDLQSPISNLQLQTSNLQSPHFVLRQFFLRTPGEEPAMLHALAEWLDTFDALVSFNGRGFDVPLLESRFRLARMRPRILRAPHLDLLTPARRVWRGRLESCRLKTLERDILDVWREQDDVDGSEIPYMYIDYIRSGDASEMPRVLYHNAVDVLSMVSLSTRLMTLFAASSRGGSGAANGTLVAGDWLALGKWHDDSGRVAEAEAALRACLAARPDLETQTRALHRLSFLLKRTARHAEALGVWEALSASQTWEGAEACVELAKHYEWREVDPDRARAWTRRAIRIARRLPAGYARDRLKAELAHRLDRLNQKCA